MSVVSATLLEKCYLGVGGCLTQDRARAQSTKWHVCFSVVVSLRAAERSFQKKAS